MNTTEGFPEQWGYKIKTILSSKMLNNKSKEKLPFPGSPKSIISFPFFRL
jgi:hypothetical protein